MKLQVAISFDSSDPFVKLKEKEKPIQAEMAGDCVS